MLNFFKKDDDNQPGDVKSIRATMLQGIKQELQKAEGGEGKNIKGIDLLIAVADNDKHIYEAAVYADEPLRLKEDIQKIADDYALDLPESWSLEVSYVDELPTEIRPLKGASAGLFIRTKDNTLRKTATAYVKVLNGKAEEAIYTLHSEEGKYNIGRESTAQTSDGFFRLNKIAFPGDVDNNINKYISRQHAHIDWDSETGSFMLYADEGGVPPGNKVKVRSSTSETLNKLVSTQIGHRLEEGDQVVLGESAVLLFTYQQ